MKSGRIKRNWLVLLSGIITLILVIVFRYSPSKISNYVELMSGALSFASIATGLLFATFSLVPEFSNSRLLNVLKKLKTDRKILDRILIATVLFFGASILSFVGLLFPAKSSNIYSIIFIGIWLAILIMAVIEVLQIIRVLFIVLENY